MKIITVNKKAFHDYEIIDKLEAGMALLGTEVKAIREGRANLKDAHVEIRNREAFLVSAHIGPYSNANINNHEPERPRKLLLHKREISRWDKKVRARGVTIVALRMFFTPKGKVKIEIALAKGKRAYDKKQKIIEKDVKRDMDREMKRYR